MGVAAMGVGVAVRVIKRLPWRFSLLLLPPLPPLDFDRPAVVGSSVWSYPEHPALTSNMSCIDNGSRAVLLAPRLRPIALLKYPPRIVKLTMPWTHNTPFLCNLTVTCEAFKENSAGAAFSSERFICHIVTSTPSSREWTNPFIFDSNLCTSSLVEQGRRICGGEMSDVCHKGVIKVRQKHIPQNLFSLLPALNICLPTNNNYISFFFS